MNFEALYHHELAERERVRSAGNVSVGVLALLGGLLGGMLQGGWIGWSGAGAAFATFSAAGVLSFLKALYHAIQCLHGHKYKVMPLALDCRAHRDALRAWHADQGHAREAADTDFGEWLEDRYAEGADRNAHINWLRSRCLFKSNQAAVLCVVFSLAAFVPFTIHRNALPQEIHSVALVGGRVQVEGVCMAEEKPKAPPPPPPKEKPQGPPLRDLVEGQLPRPPKK